MTSIGLAFAFLAAVSGDTASTGHVVAWGDTGSVLIRQFPDSLGASRWIRACGSRSVAYRSSRKLAWWGINAQDPVHSPSHRFPLRSLACSEEISLGLTDTGSVVHWGPAPSMGDPTPPAGLRDVVEIAAGSFHGVALKSDGSVVAWGANLDSVATRTNGKTGVVAISAAGVQTVMLRTDSTVEVAGGKLTKVDRVPSGLGGVVAVAAGGRHVLALRADGRVVAWGDSAVGNHLVPGDLDSVVAIAAGGYHSLALRRDGRVVCWGRNTKGQCDIPASVEEVVAISAGTEHSLALRRDGKVIAWGSNEQGQCDVPIKSVPVESIHMGRNAAAAILADGRMVAWGDVPTEPVPALPTGRRWKSISFASTPHALGIDDQGKPYAWGVNTAPAATMPDSIQLATQVKATLAVSLVLTPDRRLVAWGEDNDGLVSGPSLLEDVVQVEAAKYRVVALRADSTVHVWGKQIFLGVDVVPDSAKGSIAVAATDQSLLALRSDRKVFAWNPRPALAAWHRPPADLDSVVAISAGSVHALALRSNGRVVCWGDPTAPLCDVPRDLPPVSVAMAGEKASLALVPVRPVRGPVSGIAAPSRPVDPVLFRGESEGLRLVSGSGVTVSVFTASGSRVVSSRALRPGDRFGADLPRGIYFVRVDGQPRSFRWVRTGR